MRLAGFLASLPALKPPLLIPVVFLWPSVILTKDPAPGPRTPRESEITLMSGRWLRSITRPTQK